MNREEEVYAYLLNNCWGKQNTQKGYFIRANLGLEISDRTFRKIIQNINSSKDYMHLIGAVSGKGQNAGYFVATNKQERREVINNITHRAEEMLKNADVMRLKVGVRKKWLKERG